MKRTARGMLAAGSVLAAVAGAQAGEAVTYAGTIGDLPVIVELLDPAAGAPVGRAAYPAKGIDIPLHGPLHGAAAAGGGLVLTEEAPCTKALCEAADDTPLPAADAPVGATWRLESAGAGGLSGTWQKAGSAETLPVSLERRGARAVEDGDGAPTADSLDPTYATYDAEGRAVALTPERLPYDFLKMERPLERGPEARLGGGVYRLDTDPRTGIAYPAIVSLGGTQTGPLAAALAAGRLETSLSSFACLSRVYLGLGWTGMEGMGIGTTGYEQAPDVTVDHLSPRLMGFSETGMFTCGGAHPDLFLTRTLLDARTGRPVEAQTLMRGWVARDFDGNVLDPAAPGFDPSAAVFGPDEALVAFVREKRVRFDAETEEGCTIDDLVPDHLGVYVTQDELVLTLEGLPHAVFACTNDLLRVPLKDARPLLTDEGARYFAVLDR